MPADRRAGTILVDECHRKRLGIDASPLRNRSAQRQQKCWKRSRRPPIVRLAEERDAPPRHDATHFEVRERDVAYGIYQDALLRLRDEVLSIVEAVRETVIEETR